MTLLEIVTGPRGYQKKLARNFKITSAGDLAWAEALLGFKP